MSIIDKILGKPELQKELQEVKTELEGQLKALHEIAIVSETDIKGNITYVNDMFCEISKYSREELIGKNHRILKSGLQPDEIFVDMWKTISSGKVWRGTVCNKAKDSSYYWVNAVIVPILNEKGNPIKYVSARIDITELIRLQEELKQQNHEIYTQTEELKQINEELSATNDQLIATQLMLKNQIEALNASAIVSETDIKGNITYVNDMFCEISKYSREELIGKNHRILKSGLQPDEIFVDMWKTISSGKVWRGTVCNKAKDGSYYWVLTTIVPILNEKGSPIKYISIRYDITAEKELQEIVKSKQNQIEALSLSLNAAKKELERKLETLKTETHQAIDYAAHIQRCVMPTISEVKQDFPDKYEVGIFFQPKEAVSGDFYWSAKVHNKTIFVLGDASGHGVPGSFLSLLAINSLEYLVKEKLIIHPDILLSELDKKMKSTLKHDVQDVDRIKVDDSIEMYAVLIDNDTITISFAGCPIVLLEQGKETQIIEGVRRSIGQREIPKDLDFKSHSFTLSQGQTLCFFSDGYYTQLGGVDGHKKFSKKNFIEILEQVQVLPVPKRMEALKRIWSDWKGFFADQTDDISVVMITKK